MRVFNRRGIEKDERALQIERQEIEVLAKDRDDERAIIERSFYQRLRDALVGEVAVAGPDGKMKDVPIDEALLGQYTPGQWRQFAVKGEKAAQETEAMKADFDAAVDEIQKRFETKVEKLQRGDEMLPGVMKTVKVFVAVKRKLQPGDKMAGSSRQQGGDL